jgi:hypothetical protein
MEAARHSLEDMQANKPHRCGNIAFIIRDPEIVALSAVAEAAYKTAEFRPVGFKAGLDRYIKECRDNCNRNEAGISSPERVPVDIMSSSGNTNMSAENEKVSVKAQTGYQNVGHEV